MRRRRNIRSLHRWRNASLFVACLALVVGSADVSNGQADHDAPTSEVRGSAVDADTVVVRIDGVGKATLFRDEAGELVYAFDAPDGTRRRLDADAFAAYLLEQQRQADARTWLFHVLNISSPWGVAWVGLGLLGQVLFTGRMIVQWLVSERAHRSVVPPVFWWMSLVGATMLLVYFGWRRDIVGVLGQGAGWLIYLRNLVLIYRPIRETSALTPSHASGT